MNQVVVGLVLSALFVLGAEGSYQEELIARVREAGATWESGLNFHPNASKEYFESLGGFVDISPYLSQHKSESRCTSRCAKENVQALGHDHNSNYPTNFDARQKWSYCPSIGKIWDQGHCKSDYAISVTSAIEDRICIASKGKVKSTISAQQVISCCQDCGAGCKGGYQQEVWNYLTRRGIASGGQYKSNEGCQPYLKKPTGSAPVQRYSSKTFKTPKCTKQCYNNQYQKRSVREDLHKGKDASSLCCCSIKYQLNEHGPVTTSMVLFEDFLTYKSGIYKHVHGKRLGHIAVKIIGYGEENKQIYYLAVNSWGNQWGDKGVFKILKEDNNVEFDDYFYGAEVIV